MPTINCHITKVEQDKDTGWYRIHTDHERIRRTDTNHEELAQQAARFRRDDVLVALDYNEVESKNINPHTNKPYLNRYYEGAEPASGSSSNGDVDGIERVARPSADPTEWRICLEVGAKLAVQQSLTVPELAEFAAQRAHAQRWAEFFFFSSAPDAPSGGAEMLQVAQTAMQARTRAVQSGQQTYSEVQLGDDRPPHGDDDIPF